MLAVETDIRKKFENNTMRAEYEAVSSDLYFSLSSSAEFIDDYAEFLRNALLKNNFLSRHQKANIVRFLAKLQTQKELIELASDSEKMVEVKKASISFNQKTKINS